MQPLLVHFCNSCTYNTIVPFSASVFSQNNTCSHCGAISLGINVRGQKEEEANMQQEELARLFSTNLNLSQPQPSQPEPQQFVAEHQPQQQQEQEQSIGTQAQPVYASAHYTHTRHVVPIRHIPQSQSAPASPYIDASELEAILLRNSIDPNLLFPSQVHLFQNADDDQRLRLLELWRISPPQGRQGIPHGIDYNTSRQLYDWPPTSLAQEEAMAKLRYEKMLEERAQQEEIRRHEEQLDQSMDEDKESEAVLATRDLLTSSPDTRSAEPYITSGYDMLAQREYDESARLGGLETHLRESTKYNQATDPVYKSGNTSVYDKNVGSILDMENQYGAFEAARNYDAQPIYADDEMML